MHSSSNHFSFLVLLLLATIIFLPVFLSTAASATIDEDGAKNILSQWEQNFLFLCQIYKNHDAIDELDEWDLDQCKKLWKKYYNEDYITPITILIAYQFVVCDGVTYSEGTDCDDPYNNIEEPINLEKKDKKKYYKNMMNDKEEEEEEKDED